MFSGKIEGANRDNLLQHMNNLYGEGTRCLLRCPSLARKMSFVIHMPITRSQPNMRYLQVFDLIMVFLKLGIRNSYNRAKENMFKCAAIYEIFSTANNALVEFISRILLHKALTLECLADFVQSANNGGRNKVHYRTFTQSMNVVKRCRTDHVCHYLHQAALCYTIGRYGQCLNLVQYAKIAISAPGSIYIPTVLSLGEDRQIRKLGAFTCPVDAIMKKTLIDIFHADDLCLPELYIETHGHSLNFVMNEIRIPPLIFAIFLQYLCCKRLGCRWDILEVVLYELSLAVQCYECRHIYPDFRATSWEILGICQQMNGDNHGACHSYLMALRHNANVFKIASCIRLGTVLAEYF